jgi:thymidine phosphorylase
MEIGRAALALGAGREKKTDEIDHGAGVELLVKVGERVEAGEVAALLYGERNVERAQGLVGEALELSEEPVESAAGILDSL